VWIHDDDPETNLPRRETLAAIRPVTGVGVPIFVGETVVAVLEFFKANASFDAPALIRFFQLLSIQLSSFIARQRAEVEARRHVAGLANASKMATLGEIAAGVAHEINNPLHTLTLTSHLLQRLSNNGQLSQEVLQSQLAKVENSVQRMATIVSELKAFSRDSTHDEYKLAPLRTLVNETLDMCHARLLSKDIRVRVSEIPSAWQTECRPNQISQVILNLLNNACDATLGQPERWIRLDVRDKGSLFEIAVTDSGSGVPKDISRKIMAPFFTTKPPGKGTGLGLSISSNIMTDHGGSLALDHTSPHTRFVMTLPKRRGEESSPKAIGE
jgi:C4-dicarboxylate-specific signal transduction histidine kinase